MCVKGQHKDIEVFYNAMSQNGNIYMGRGADAEIRYEDEEGRAFIDGWCKWSVESAMITNAISMRTETGTWYFGDKDPSQLEFITLMEASERWNLAVEVYSEECGCEFQEHLVIVNGEWICDECVDWCEYDLNDYETREEAEDELDIKITDEEWINRFVTRGGFEEWEFEI
jgi:hypothetical protein